MQRQHINSRGDTIVEVLISIAIISLALAVSYATTNHNTRSIQDAQERGQALQVAQRQIELLRSTGPLDNTKQCFGQDNRPAAANRGTPGGDPCTQTSVGQQAAAGAAPAYQIDITCDSGSLCKVNIRWDSLVSDNQDNLTMYYRS